MKALSILNVAAGADTGGQGIRIKQAFDKHAPGWTYRCMVKSNAFMAYPVDLPHRERVLDQLWGQVDVIHFRNNFYAARQRPRKPAVVQYHGTLFRGDPNRHVIEQLQYGALGIVSTLDLWLLAPEHTEWLPAPYDLDWLASLRTARDDGRVLIAHAPTNRQVKSTQQLLDAVKRLKAEGFPVELDLIEHRPWTECLERKAKADIYFDQVILGYGCNALEAWGMGIPVIAGAQDDTLDEMERRFGQLPFYHATQETIYDALKELVESPRLRAKYGKIGLEHVRKFHDEKVVVEQLKHLYQRAIQAAESQAA